MNKKNIARKLLEVINGTFLTKETAIKQLPFLLFLTFLMICYIANIHYAEKNIREIDKCKGELKELRSEYITTKSELMFKSKQSELAKAVSAIGLKESVNPPKKITVGKKDG